MMRAFNQVFTDKLPFHDTPHIAGVVQNVLAMRLPGMEDFLESTHQQCIYSFLLQCWVADPSKRTPVKALLGRISELVS